MDVGRRDTLPGLGATENPGRALHPLETLQDTAGQPGRDWAGWGDG